MGQASVKLKENEKKLQTNLGDEVAKQLIDMGLAALLARLVGAGAGVLMFGISLAASQIGKMRELALEDVRTKYGDQTIAYIGQQVGPAFPSEDCWAFVHKVGGTLWVQHVYVTSDTGLSFMMFWHRNPQFELLKDVIRVYRGNTQCLIEDTRPTIRAARTK